MNASADDSKAILEIAEEVKAKLKSEVDIEIEQKIRVGNKLPNFGEVNKVFGEGKA